MDNILIVDDEISNLVALKRFIEDNIDWNVFTASNEEAAKEILSRNNIDVIITDLVMANDQSGIEVLRFAKKKDPLIAVILVTAFEQMLNRYEAFELGAFDCVSKNTPGVQKIEEIVAKARAGLSYRKMTQTYLENENRLTKLRRYFDPNVLDIIEKKGDLLNIHLQTVTIVFWDIRGFSKLCEILKAHPSLISVFLKNYFHLASEIIFAQQGVLDKFIGDGVMGLFGVFPLKNDEGYADAIKAVRAALLLRNSFEELSKEWIEKWALYVPQSIDIGLGCGLHTGEALVGNVGTEMRDQFTALGPHVNFAQRLESRAQKGQIIISSTTKARISTHFNVNNIGILIDIKNIPGEFEIYEVISSKS